MKKISRFARRKAGEVFTKNGHVNEKASNDKNILS